MLRKNCEASANPVRSQCEASINILLAQQFLLRCAAPCIYG